MSSFEPTSEPTSGIDDREVLDALDASVIVTDGSGRIVQWNSATTELFGWLGDDSSRRRVQMLLATAGARRLHRSAGNAGALRPVPVEHADGTVSHYTVDKAPLSDAAGALTVWTVNRVDLDASWMAPKLSIGAPGADGSAVSRIAGDLRTDVLSELDSALARCHSVGDVLAAVPAGIVPRIADWCGLFAVPGSDPEAGEPLFDHAATGAAGALTRAVAACIDSGDISDVAAPVPAGVATVVATGRRSQVDLTAPGAAGQLGYTDDQIRILRDFGLHTSLLIPIASGGHPFGALHLLRGDGFRTFDDDEADWLGQVAVRIATILGPLRASERNQGIAEIFQEALLPDDFPPIPGFDVSARYRPGIADVEVAGDFYDVVGAGPDHWVFLMGDVCGRGPVAAARTGLVRHSFRMSAWHGDAPERILDWLDRALRSAGDGVLCTAAVASLDRELDDTWRLTCALGGHPQPIVCRVGGTVEYVGEYGMLLGTDLPAANTSVTTGIGPGDAVLFYTDGITDVAPPHQVSQERLLELVAAAWADCTTASDLVDLVLVEADRIVALDERDDDIALMAFSRT